MKGNKNQKDNQLKQQQIINTNKNKQIWTTHNLD